MLANHDVDHIVVVNKETAEIFLKADKLKDPRYKEVANKSIGGGTSGPHYFFNIGSVETFNTNLEKVQEGIAQQDRVTVSYEVRKNWGGDFILNWLVPLGLIVLLS